MKRGFMLLSGEQWCVACQLSTTDDKANFDDEKMLENFENFVCNFCIFEK